MLMRLFNGSFVDRDMVMRYHFGHGVGHVYSHGSMSDYLRKRQDVSSPHANGTLGIATRSSAANLDATEPDHPGSLHADIPSTVNPDSTESGHSGSQKSINDDSEFEDSESEPSLSDASADELDSEDGDYLDGDSDFGDAELEELTAEAMYYEN